jgi:hypothetical protein
MPILKLYYVIYARSLDKIGTTEAIRILVEWGTVCFASLALVLHLYLWCKHRQAQALAMTGK